VLQVFKKGSITLTLSVCEDDRGLCLDVADTWAVSSDSKSGETCITPGLAPGVLDQPVFLVQVVVVAESDDGHG